MLHRTLFSHIAMFIVLFLGALPAATHGQSMPFLDTDLIAIGESIDVFVPASGIVLLQVVDRTAPSGETPAWIDLMATSDAHNVGTAETLSRRLDQMVAWVAGPATYRVVVGVTDPASSRRERLVRVRGEWFPQAGGFLAKDGDGDDTGESDNEILPITMPQPKDGDGDDTGESDNEILPIAMPQTKDGDGDDTGESDNEILPVAMPQTKDGDGDDTGESDNEILPLTGEPVVGWLGQAYDLVLAKPSRVVLTAMADDAARISIRDGAGRVLANQVMDRSRDPGTIALTVPAGRYRVTVVGLGDGMDAFALSAQVERLAY